MLAPCRFAVRLALSIVAVVLFALAYLVALALEAPDLRTAATPRTALPASSKAATEDADLVFGAADHP